MADGIYTTLTRQSGLMREMQMVANNVANASTTGYRAEALIFAEHVQALGPDMPSLSMATATGHMTRQLQGGLSQTGGSFDFAIEGEGFFQIQGPDGLRLTRAGAFMPNGQGDLVTPDGYPVLDAGGAPVFVPPDARDVYLASDGTLSAGGVPIALIGVVLPEDPLAMRRTDGVSFAPGGDVVPVENPRVLQGFLEGSNVDPVAEITRMIQVQRSYEMGQSFSEREDERMRSIMRLVGR
jgi:flagellar basal-body rod protein FlgF